MIDGNPETWYQHKLTAPGDIRFADTDQSGRVDQADITTVGNPHPTSIYKLLAGAILHGFDISMAFDGAFGYDFLNRDKTWSTATGGLGNRLAEMERYRFPYSPVLNLPRVHLNDPNDNSRIHSGMVEKGNYLRLNKIGVG